MSMYHLSYLSRNTQCQSSQQLALEFLNKDACTQIFPTISKLLVHALVLPMSTTDCERCFSAMNCTKTDYRNRMHTETLDCLLRVKIEGPPLQDFNFREAIARWSRVKKTADFLEINFPFFSVYNNYTVKTGDRLL